MNDDTQNPTPSRFALLTYLQILRRQWWVPVLTAAVALVAAIVYTQTATPEYSSSMKIVIGQGRTLFSPVNSNSFQPFTQTMTDLLRSNIVARETIAQRRLETTPKDLLDKVSVSANPDTSVLQVSLTGTDRAANTQTLAAMGEVFVRLIDGQLANLGSARTGTTARTGSGGDDTGADEPVSASVFDPAHGDPDQVSPHALRTPVLALILGLIAGVLLAFLRDALSSRIRGTEEAAEAYGTAVLAGLPTGVLGVKPSEVRLVPPRVAEPIREAVGLLVASLRYGAEKADGGVIVVTSARPEEGKTSVVAHVSGALSDAGAWVAAVEGDLQRPALARMFGLASEQPGLGEVLSGRSSAEDALSVVPRAEPSRRDGSSDELFSRLEVLTAGPREARPAELLTLESFDKALRELRGLVDWVVVDTPPLLVSGEAFPLLQLADHVVVVCREGQSTRDDAQAVAGRMRALGVEHWSVVVTESSEAAKAAYGYATAG